jgi:ATP-dependent DNA ligase
MRLASSLRPEAVAQVEFVEWTQGNRLRHSKCVGLREDNNPQSMIKEEIDWRDRGTLSTVTAN